MELRVLRYFLAIAREGNITAAAKALHVTQPTLSRQIRDLEDEVRTRLFERRSHSVALTADGIRLRQRAEEILAMVEKTEAEFGGSGSDDVTGEIHIGGGETLAMRLVADILYSMRQEYPGIRYQLHSGNAVDVADRVDRGLLDFGVIIQPADLRRYDSVRLPAKDVWGVLMPKSSPLATKRFIRRKDLLGVPLICSRWAMQGGGVAKNALVAWLGTYLDKLDVVATYNLIYNAAIMVSGGLGHAICLDGLANTNTASNLCFRRLEPRVESGLDVIWKKYRVFSPAAQIFLTRLREKSAPPA